MAPVLPNYGYAFGDTGYVINADFGGNPNALPFFDVDSITGLDGAPPRVNTSDRSDRDGAFVSAPYTQMRTIVINGIWTACGSSMVRSVKVRRHLTGSPSTRQLLRSLSGSNTQVSRCASSWHKVAVASTRLTRRDVLVRRRCS